MNKPIRLRFAPSPTGMMHLGNIRTALMNALFTFKNKGFFVLRIEDTDAARNFDPGAQHIIQDLTWLGLAYDEGPGKGGPYAPYFQSERAPLYQKALDQLIASKAVYRCFCSPEELEKQRARQIALKKPPRYDRTCLQLSTDTINKKLDEKIPFIWRYLLDHTQQISITDLAHGVINFDVKNFSDFPLTRGDGSFTFIFANFVDDMLMDITHVIRGEDHLTNTACQAVLFHAFKATIPTFWHLPILCNTEGKKLSKRDFGFSLRDLKNNGFLPEAIINYLAIIGGGSFANELMSFQELAQTIDFDHINATGQVKFDPEKLRWMNNKWIARISTQELYERCLPYLTEAYPSLHNIDTEQLKSILQILKTDLFALGDIVNAMRFYFEQPVIDTTIITPNQELKKALQSILRNALEHSIDNQTFVAIIKEQAKTNNVGLKDLFVFVRTGLMGSAQGPSILELMQILGTQESKKRLQKLLDV